MISETFSDDQLEELFQEYLRVSPLKSHRFASDDRSNIEQYNEFWSIWQHIVILTTMSSYMEIPEYVVKMLSEYKGNG